MTASAPIGAPSLARSITLTSARSASGTPSPVTPEMTSGVALRRALEARLLLAKLLGRQRIGLVERDDLRLVGEIVAVGHEFLTHGLVGLPGMLAGAVDEVEQHPAALDMAEKPVAEARALMRAGDQPGDVGEHEFAAVDRDDAELRMQRGEGIVGDLRPRRAHRGKEGRLAGIGQADEPGIGDQLEAQPDGALLAGQAGIGMARRAVGRGLEVKIAEAAIAALGQHHALAELGQVGEQGLVVLVEDLRALRAP